MPHPIHAGVPMDGEYDPAEYDYEWDPETTDNIGKVPAVILVQPVCPKCVLQHPTVRASRWR